MKIKIPNTEIQELLSGKGYEYPKYSRIWKWKYE